MTRAVATKIAAIQYHVVQILVSLYLPDNDSKIDAINGGIASGKNPIGSGNTFFEKYARVIMLMPAANAIWMCGDLISSLNFDTFIPQFFLLI